MSPQNPRRPSSSRTTTPRPRKIAGRLPEETDAPERAEPVEPVETVETVETKPVATPQDEPRDAPDQPSGVRRLAVFADARLTRTLLIALVVIAVVIAAQGVWFLVHSQRKDDLPKARTGEIVVPAGRPVVMNQSDIDQGLDQAAKDVVTLMSLRYKTFDADVAKAADLMTSRYAPQFKGASADVKENYVAKRINLSAKVNGQGVVRANTTQLQALLFVSQFVSKGIGKQRRLTLTQFRVLLTMVHTNTGWLVDGMETK